MNGRLKHSNLSSSDHGLITPIADNNSSRMDDGKLAEEHRHLTHTRTDSDSVGVG